MSIDVWPIVWTEQYQIMIWTNCFILFRVYLKSTLLQLSFGKVTSGKKCSKLDVFKMIHCCLTVLINNIISKMHKLKIQFSNATRDYRLGFQGWWCSLFSRYGYCANWMILNYVTLLNARTKSKPKSWWKRLPNSS